MTGKAYNAGTIFLQVVPVFGHLQEEVGREAKAMNRALGDEMEKGGADAGKRAGKAMGEELSKNADKDAEKYVGAFATRYRDGMRKMNRELGPINIEVEDKNVTRTFEEIKARAKALRNIKVGIDISSKEAVTELARLELQLKLLQEQAKDIQVKADLKSAHAQIGAFMAEIQRAHPEIKIDTDFRDAERNLGRFEKKFSDTMKNAAKGFGSSLDPEIRRIQAELDSLGDAEIGVDLHDTDAKTSLRYLIAEMERIDGDTITIGARANLAGTLADLKLLEHEVRKLDGENIDIDTSKTSASIGDTSNNFRALNGILLAAVLLIPALIPIIAALGGALLALGPAIAGVGAGFGVMLLGFSGVAAAVKAMGAVHKNAAKDAESAAKRIRSAARSVDDAERSLTRTREDVAQRNADAARAVEDAERSAARGVEAALKQRADAVRNAAGADRDAAAAQRDLIKARRQAKADLVDNKDARAQNALDQRQGVIDVFNATVTDQTTRQDGASTNLEKEQAAINLANAQLRLKNLREEGVALAQRDKAGVEGTDKVKTAQDALGKALERQKEAHKAVGEASKNVDRARQDGARQVAQAVQQQQRTEADGARSLADAQRGLLRAQQDYQDALTATGDIGSSSMNTLRDAMAKLSPAGRRFATFLYGLKDEFYAIRTAAQEGMLPGVQSALETIMSRYGKPFTRFVRVMGKTIGDVFRQFGQMLTNPLWSDFFGMLSDLGPRFFRQFAKMSMNWMSIFARLLTIAAPWAVKFSDALLAMSKHALNFVKSKKGTKVITDFMAYAEKVGPKVWQFFKDLVAAVINLADGLAPVGGLMLGLLDGILKFIAGIPPKVLGAIAVVIITLVVAFQALNAILAVASIGVTLFAAVLTPVLGPILLIVGGFILLIGVLVALYTQSETAKKIMNAAFRAIGAVGKWVWEKMLKPAFSAIGWGFKMLWKGIQWAWKNVLEPVFRAIGDVVGWLWHKVFKPVLGFIVAYYTSVFKVMRWVWNNILWPVIDLIGHVIWDLWKLYFKVAIGLIKRIWHDVADTFRMVWRNVIKPIFDAFMDTIGNKLVSNFRKGMDTIAALWSGLKSALSVPIVGAIKFINKYLIGGFNKVADFVGSKHMGEIPLPSDGAKPKPALGNPGGSSAQTKNTKRFATGGVLPGYTPGRDVHHFRSPTGGNLHLSGGEGILRPEVIKAAGPDWLHKLNLSARKGGVDGVRKAMGITDSRFAKGGVFWPTTGHVISTYKNHDGVDINAVGEDYGNPIFAYRAGTIAYTGWGKGYGDAIFESIPGGPTVVYGHGSKVLVQAGQHVVAGQKIGEVGSTGHSTGNHLHFGIPGGTYDQALALLHGATNITGGGAAGGVHFPKWMSKILGTPVKWANGLADKAAEAMKSKLGDSPLIGMLGNLGHKLAHGLAEKVTGFMGQATGEIASIAHGPAQKIVEGMAAARGWTGEQWNAIKTIVQRESGWDPNAANPGSSARGLFQKMTSVHGPVESTVQGQAAWGLNYIADRYGTPTKALDFWNSHGNYADGGIIGEGDSGGVPSNGTMMYDNGGYLPPGLTTVLNLTGKPEPVFTSDQFAHMQGAGGGGGFTYAPTFNASDLTAQDVAEDLNFAFRSLSRTGKYSGKDA